ncbi:hypothetical protein ACOSQ4_029925 [Xanthoceras sorbifolium]
MVLEVRRLFKILFLFNLFVWAYGAPQISSWALLIVFLGCGGAQPKLDASSSLTPPLQMEEPPPTSLVVSAATRPSHGDEGGELRWICNFVNF